jgi:hypothetical protein
MSKPEQSLSMPEPRVSMPEQSLSILSTPRVSLPTMGIVFVPDKLEHFRSERV